MVQGDATAGKRELRAGHRRRGLPCFPVYILRRRARNLRNATHDSRSTHDHFRRGDAAMATKKSGRGTKRSAGKKSTRRGPAISKRSGGRKKSATKRSGAKRSATKGTAKRSTAKRSTAKRGTAKKSTMKRGSASKRGGSRGASRGGTSRSGSSASSAAKKSGSRRGGAARVKRVAGGVVEQAQHAVVTGFEAVKEFGETIVDRVTS
jgi:hypothetical protein